MNHIDVLIAEIGSTTTIVNAFNIDKEVKFLGRGVSNTTVNTQVHKGLRAAIDDLKVKFGGITRLNRKKTYATSSAAGGLKMGVSGLVYDMTVKAAKEGATNAGANIHHVVAGSYLKSDLERLKESDINMILISGGTDYGDWQTAYYNFLDVIQLELNVPIIYAGNIENHDAIKSYIKNHSQKDYISIVENVYPRLDYLNVKPLRRKIYEIFEKHIVHAKGMNEVRRMVKGSIIPTPGSVMEATILLAESIGNTVVIDVGGATTDVHSVTEFSDDFKKYFEGEPREKRTVEGDIGVFLNHLNIVHQIGKSVLAERMNVDIPLLDDLLQDYKYIPTTDLERRLVYELTRYCVYTALDRHIGDYRNVFSSGGRKVLPDGRDLTQIQHVVLTGGALVNLDNTEVFVKEYFENSVNKLVPTHEVKIYKDHDYIMSSIGVLALNHPKEASVLLKKSLHIEEHE